MRHGIMQLLGWAGGSFLIAGLSRCMVAFRGAGQRGNGKVIWSKLYALELAVMIDEYDGRVRNVEYVT